MKKEILTIQEYLSTIDKTKKTFLTKLKKTINNSIPKGFKEELNCNIIGWVVPHTIYPEGYHCNPTSPLPFVNIAAQKNFIALYHMGIYANPDLHDWFVCEYPKHCATKLDMGKSCIRFKKPEAIPHELIAELMTKMSVDDWLSIYKKVRPK